MNNSVLPGLILPTALRATSSASAPWSPIAWRTWSGSISSSGTYLGPGPGDHHVVDRRQAPEERLQRSGVVGIEGLGPSRADFPRRLLQPVGIAGGEDDVGTLGSRTPRR